MVKKAHVISLIHVAFLVLKAYLHHIRVSLTKIEIVTSSNNKTYIFIGFGAAVICFAIISCIIGIATVCFVSEKTENFFVAGRNLPLWIVIFTLASASLDSNALLGNADLSYKFQFWDGAVLPIGLGLSLILNGVFLARHIQKENALTLPEIYAKRYGRFVEILISLVTMASFLFLLAGNLVGMGSIFSYLFNMNPIAGIWISMIIITIYTG